jgi:hypothetical protein
MSAVPRGRQPRALGARERSQRVTPNDLSREHAALVKAAVDGKLNRRQLMVRGMAIGLSATALAGLLSAYRSPVAVAQSPVAGAQDNPLAGQTIDMTILGIAGWPPSRLGVDLANDLFKPYAKETYGYDVTFAFEGRRSNPSSRRPPRRSNPSPPSTTSSSPTASGWALSPSRVGSSA